MYDPDRPMGTLQRMQGPPPPQQPYYYADRVSYASPTGTGRYTKSAVTVERYKPAFGPCMWILTILAILLVLILVICLILFFTWGSGYRGNGTGVSYYDKSGGPPHALEQPDFILNALKSGDRKLCILDTAYMNPNYAQLYAEEHIPTAKHFDINKVLNENNDFGDQSVVTPLINILDFQNYVRSLGVTKDCHITLYDHGEAKNSILTATYVWYLFRLHNYNKVTIINGGLKAWKDWTKNEPRYQATNIIRQNGNTDGDFQAGWNPNLWLGFDDLKNMTGRKNGPQIVDARQPDYYHGKSKHKDAKDAGRILGALNAPVEEVIRSDNGGFKILPDVKTWLTDKGVTMDRPTVLYSDSGVHASGLYFLISQTGTKQSVKVYHNGWIEWSYKAPEQLKESG